MGLEGPYTSIYTGNTQLIHYIKEDRLGRIKTGNDLGREGKQERDTFLAAKKAANEHQLAQISISVALSCLSV